VDWTAQRLRVRQSYSRGNLGTPKSDTSSRGVPLADVLAGELDRLHQASLWKADSDLVFAHPHTGKAMERSRLLKRFKAALKRAGVREVAFHDLRHTFGTKMASTGVPMRTLQAWMGHEDYKTTQIYADYAPAANEADLIGQAMKGIGPSPVPSPVLSETGENSEHLSPANTGDQHPANP
jgi:integrase